MTNAVISDVEMRQVYFLFSAFGVFCTKIFPGEVLAGNQ